MTDHGRIDTAVPWPPFVERRIAYAMLTAKFGYWQTGFVPRKIAKIWRSLYLVIFIQNLLVHLAEKL